MNPRVESDHFVHQAIVTGDVAIVSQYLAEGGSPNITDCYDCEPIYTAVKYDRLDIAVMLLSAGANIFRRSKFRGDPFGAACWNRNLRMIDFCIAAGIEINAVHQGQTILDDFATQKEWLADTSMPSWQATYDKLVQLGAKHSHETAS